MMASINLCIFAILHLCCAWCEYIPTYASEQRCNVIIIAHQALKCLRACSFLRSICWSLEVLKYKAVEFMWYSPDWQWRMNFSRLPVVYNILTLQHGTPTYLPATPRAITGGETWIDLWRKIRERPSFQSSARLDFQIKCILY